MLYRISIQYESTPQGVALDDTAVVDEPLTRGALFYGKWGRAHVTKCCPIHESARRDLPLHVRQPRRR